MSDVYFAFVEHITLILNNLYQIRAKQTLKMLDSIFGGQALDVRTL